MAKPRKVNKPNIIQFYEALAPKVLSPGKVFAETHFISLPHFSKAP